MTYVGLMPEMILDAVVKDPYEFVKIFFPEAGDSNVELGCYHNVAGN